MKRLDATWGAQRNHEPARSGGCQTTATRFMGSPAAISGAPRGYETTKKRNAGFIDSPAARDGCATALIGSGTKSNERGAFPLEKNLADDNDTDSYHQAVRTWKALVEIADNKGVAPFVAGWAKARINLLDPGAAIRPAPSARPETERLAAWWSKSVTALNQKLGKSDFPLETVDASVLLQVPGVYACDFRFLGLHLEKLGFTSRYRRTRCAYDEPERAVSGEFRRVRVGLKQPHGSLPNRSRDKVASPQLPSGRMVYVSILLPPATGTCQVSHPRTTRGRARHHCQLPGERSLTTRNELVVTTIIARPRGPVFLRREPWQSATAHEGSYGLILKGPFYP
jgi:hypothetical protein